MTAATGPVIAIIGGGLSGAVTSHYLARQLQGTGAKIVIYEPRALVGAGLAYDTDAKAHRINVPATRMSFYPDDSEDFLRWLQQNWRAEDDPEALTPTGQIFPRREVFGRYAAAQIEPLLVAGQVEHCLASVSSVSPLSDGRFAVVADGNTLTADVVVLAATHPSPHPPQLLQDALKTHPHYVPDALVKNALETIGVNDRVLIVGTGLTAADVIASLHENNHQGDIVAVSRRGLRSRGHNLIAPEASHNFTEPPSTSAVQLLRRVRAQIAEAAREGIAWQAIFNKLRAQGSDIWRALPLNERRRLVRHLRIWWDVHRFRVAPQIEDIMDQRIAQGKLSIRAGAITSVRCEGDDIHVSLRPRFSRSDECHVFDAVVVTTGPGHSTILLSQPVFAGLADKGLLRIDDVGLGLRVDDKSRAIGAGDVIAPNLFVAGPLARGTFGELMGLPQVTEHAVFVAQQVALVVDESRLVKTA